MIKTIAKDLMNEDFPYGIIPSKRVEILTILRKNRLSYIPVVSEDTCELKGTISISDIAKNPDENQIAVLLNRTPKTVQETDDIKTVVKLLLSDSQNIVCVINNDRKLLGVITPREIISKAKMLTTIDKRVLDYTKFDITSIYSETPLPAAWEIMRLSRSNALCVVNFNGNLEGMIDDSDLIGASSIIQSREVEVNIGSEDAWAWQTSDFLYIVKKTLKLPTDVRVKDVMTTEVITIVKSETIAKAATKMKDNNVENIPVIDSFGTIIGIIRDKDLLLVLLQQLES